MLTDSFISSSNYYFFGVELELFVVDLFEPPFFTEIALLDFFSFSLSFSFSFYLSFYFSFYLYLSLSFSSYFFFMEGRLGILDLGGTLLVGGAIDAF